MHPLSQKKQGHPGRAPDPKEKATRRVNDLMRQATKMVQELEELGAPSDVMVHAQAGSLSLMTAYSWLTGLPQPWDSRAAQMGWDKV